uniref:MAT1 centre domain-containing protein n=1 Tax=Tetraselmis sp. GSL018 TaxID=582737 RepID=A0A061RNU1_9CHLO|mmetsp:Transcript_18283/g.43719  ORF Transcript_18283/g.43719 Transcript_18283/m.43719 type:complete len:175 (-) Transcript_18283:249-773(-)|eukprot:CAMPEP_0177578310 /NCGR_PEP_ID=MMETSP0419_2-20121207/274_1 /TAXON_ID=582737 /ORGANISM="Tetraselmis sp., Strain GSL018" /LENGTH=174 /DNA_ID=CAMNT_0019066733 /DNA_START=130 /DNA_END=654 /DNA_ORIENTATION=+
MEDPELDLDQKTIKKHIRIRKRIENIYNKLSDDFENKRDYDDYLEEREDIIFNLCENIDVDATEARVRAYEAANSASIAANLAKRAHAARPRPESAGPVEEKVTDATAPDALHNAAPAFGAAANQLPPQPAPVANQAKRKAPPKPSMTELKAGGWDPGLPSKRMIRDLFDSLVL